MSNTFGFVKNLGELDIEKVLLAFDSPELFVCKGANGERYLALFIDDNEYKHLLVRIDTSTLIKMLHGDITIEQAFRNKNSTWILRYNQGQFCAEVIDNKDLKADELPEQGVYFKIHNRGLQEYIEQLQKE